MRIRVRFGVVATLLLFVLASSHSTSSHSAVVKPLRILVLFPHFGKSHYDVFEHLFKTLAERGHHITAVTHFPQNPPVKNYRQILIDQPELQKTHAFDIGIFTRSFVSKFAEPVLLSYLSGLTCDTLGQPEIQALLRKPKNSFDLILVEAFNTDCYLGFVHHFGNVPFIAVSSSAILPWYNERIGNSENPAFINNILMGYWSHMSFHERVVNSVAYLAHNIFYRQTQRWWTDVAVRKYFHNDAIPSTEDIALNCSLILVNSHHSLHGAQANSPRMMEVGGIHVGKNLMKKLPENIEKWLNESSDTEGVIYFSMGSMIKGHTFPVEKRQAFLKAFARFPRHRVLWKWETETMPDKPENVMIQKWMPQFDILCHPKVKAFISHGGMLGTTEAVHCGVPILVMPQFGDQHTNARALEASGGGVILNFQDVTEDSVVQGLQTILDHKFNKQAKELSERFRDRPLPPLETAIYWIEYVARHKGAPHMRTAAVGMPFYQYLLLDVIAFLATIVFIFAYITKKIIRAIFARICGSGKKTESTLIKKKQR